jgi:(R)-2-hydroxyglutarate---pyruvate transhydrogenase
VIADAYTPEILAALEPFVYELVGMYMLNASFTVFNAHLYKASHKGSVSAEHGIGAMKTHALRYSKSEVSITWMKNVKNLFDPRGIMNPGKVLEYE